MRSPMRSVALVKTSMRIADVLRLLVISSIGSVGILACSEAKTGPSLQPCANTPRSEEVCIRGGEFSMGHDPIPYVPPPCPPPSDGGNNCGPGSAPPANYSPVHQVTLRPFFIDRHAISNAEYLECFAAGSCPDD